MVKHSVFDEGTGTSTSVSYDSAGNESAIGSASYAYSTRNLLASGDGISYTYDGYGQRVSATTTIGGSSATETSLYGPGRHLETQSSLTSGSSAYDYIWLGDVPVAEEDIAGSHTYWTAIDHLNAPIILTNASAAIAWQADYEPFGALYQVRTGSSIHQPLRFPGQEAELFDGSAGINGFSRRLYNGMRWYRPQWGRYTQADMLGYRGSPYNLYVYANNDPTNYIDPMGTCSESPSKDKAPCLIPALTGLLLSSATVTAETGLIAAEVAAVGSGVGAWTLFGFTSAELSIGASAFYLDETLLEATKQCMGV